ncbi:MAG: hypothetical protein AVDCRST_MAG66-3215 [uncultured Pseudonocardia sp.]|uniref:PAS domain-containing protein n=1 Tax=uncultured Pseudonocardia sp. TaxID=211455 RepID=A0A6J4PZH0_9PSEU|nr:MAG: hypothetical protein AVDCRST_MAG66-3215 [uncultured Pseudonocardia sp.]
MAAVPPGLGRRSRLAPTRPAPTRPAAAAPLDHARRDAQERFTAFLEHLPVQAWIRDGEGRYRWANREHLRHLGGPRDLVGRTAEELGARWCAFDHPGAARPVRAEHVVDGAPRVLQGSVFPLRGPGGHDRRAALSGGFLTDVTELRDARDEAARARQLFETFMHHAPVAAFIRDADGRYLFANPAYCHTYRLDPATLVGRSVREVTTDELATAVVARDQEVLRGGRAVHDSRTFVRGDGSEGSEVGHRFPLPGPAVGGVFLEVSETERLRRAVREAEQRFVEIFQHTGLAIAVFSTDGHLLDANVAYTHLLGAPLSELTGRHMRSIVTPATFAQDTPKWLGLVSGALRSYRTAASVRRHDGSVILARCTISIVRAADGRAKYIYSVNDPKGFEPGPDGTGLPPLVLEELSPEEHVILTTLARGDTLSDAGAELHLTRSGVDHHLCRLRQRLGLPRGTRTAGLVARAYALGVLAPGSWPPRVAMPVAPR